MAFKTSHQELYDSLHYLKMAELKKLCLELHLQSNGTKVELIQRIMHFFEKGIVLKPVEIPEASRAKKNQLYPLQANTLMLFGAYKNDAQTRAFFKTLIGNHFHFTAFGIDWLKMRWQRGNPPTYQEFAHLWQKEVALRKEQKPQPKKEWAYITFVQQYIEKHPSALKDEILQAWNAVRAEMVARAYEILKK